ncbi:methyltransferase domain-containing protein [bacterium]|nr:methyltransferase domain-containing protein [bacterium]
MSLHPVEHKILEQLDAAKILELGAGRGYIACELSQIFDYVVGVEPETKVVFSDESQKHYSETENFDIVAAYGEGLPFDNSTFDCVISHWSLHHYTYPYAVFAESYRVLKNNGYLYLADGVDIPQKQMTPKQRNHFLFHEIAVSVDRIDGKNHFPLYRQKDFIKIVENTGFKIKNIEIITDENPDDIEYEQDYIKSYCDILQKLADKMIKSGKSSIVERLNELKKSIENTGIRISPFVIVLGQK